MKNIVWGGVVLLCVAAPARAGDIADAARRTIAAANEGWLPALKQQDAAAVAEPYSDDGVFVTPDGAVVVGPAGVEAMMRSRFAAVRVLDGVLVQDGIRMEGPLIYEWGHVGLDVQKADGTKATSRGRYLTVWKQSPDGRWRIWRNLSLTD